MVFSAPGAATGVRRTPSPWNPKEVILVLIVVRPCQSTVALPFPHRAGPSRADASTAAVLEVLAIERVRHEPLVDAERATRLEDAEDLAIHAFEGGRVYGSLDGVNCIEGVVREGDFLCVGVSVIYSLPCRHGGPSTHTMKSPWTKSSLCDRFSLAAYLVARSTWYWLRFSPVTWQPVN